MARHGHKETNAAPGAVRKRPTSCAPQQDTSTSDGTSRNNVREPPAGQPQQQQPALPMNGTALTLGAVLAVLVGYFVGQLRELYVELSRERGSGAANVYIAEEECSSRSTSGADARGVAGVLIDWDLERTVQQQMLDERDDVARSSNGASNAVLAEKIKQVSDFVERNEPFVCRDCMPAESLRSGWWDLDSNLLDAIGTDTILPIRVAEKRSNDDGDTPANPTPTHFQRSTAPGARGRTKSAYKERNMTAPEFFASYKTHSGQEGEGGGEGRVGGDSEHWYAAQVDIVAKLPGLLKYVLGSAPPKHQILEAVGPTPPTSHHPITLYFGAGERTTQLHYDSLENIVCLASGGTKTFELYDPASSAKFLYIDRSVHGNGSPVPPSDPGLEYPVAKFAHPSRMTLRPGDCLYLPVYWYHAVTSSEERTISINWWRSPDREKMVMLENLFCGRADYYGASAKC